MSHNQSRSRKKILVKIVILGESRVGKTALLHKYVMGKFIEDHKATIGADFLTKEFVIGDKLVTLQLWDTAGQERFQSLGNAFYRGSDACILMYDISNQKSFQQIDIWKEKFLSQAGITNGHDYPFLLLGNKCDRNDREVETQMVERYAQDKNMVFFETSALNGTNVEVAIHKISSDVIDSPDLITGDGDDDNVDISICGKPDNVQLFGCCSVI